MAASAASWPHGLVSPSGVTQKSCARGCRLNLIEEARQWTNPFEATPENIAKGKAIFQGKAFCATCHGQDGRGLADIPDLRGKLPRNFTDHIWQAARSDGELFWILKNGSPGTDMASFVPSSPDRRRGVAGAAVRPVFRQAMSHVARAEGTSCDMQ